MPVQLREFYCNTRTSTGNGLADLIANVGDEVELKYLLTSAIRITSVNNPLTFDPSTDTVTSSTLSWLDEGFRQGDLIWVAIYTQNTNTGVWSVTDEHWESVTFVSDTEMNFLALPIFYTLQGDPQMMTFTVVGGTNQRTARQRSDLEVLLNNPLNSQTGNQSSLIDAEVTRFKRQGNLSVGTTDSLTSIPNQSGGFYKSVTLQRTNDDGDGFNTYYLRVTLCLSGIYDQQWFLSAECQKSFARLLWSAKYNETANRFQLDIEPQANTGWFNEANNSSIPQTPSVLISGVTNDIDYATAGAYTFTFEGILSSSGIGSAYIPINDDYYRNVAQSQYGLTMILPTTDLVNNTTYQNAVNNPLGAGYTIAVDSIVSNGNTHVVTFTFTPNSDFTDFMENNDGDRLFYIWVNAGNINHLLYADQLTKVLPIGGPLNMETDYGFFDHSENIENTNDNKINFVCDTEDDVGYFGRFAMQKDSEYSGLRIKLEAYNSVTAESFELRDTYINFSGVQTSNAGELLLNETIPLENTLPTTSVKREGRVINLNTQGATPNDYLVSVYYPFLLNWKYWLPLLDANVDFYPTQNNNWEQYDNIANWEIRIRLELEKDGLAFFHNNVIRVNPYDFNDQIQTNISLFRLDNTSISVIPDGEILKIRARHFRTDGNNWDPDYTWGMITIEPKESEQRFICSSIVPFDNNQANPLTPLSGLTITITYPSPDLAELTCYFDTAKINTANGVKITSKICEGCTILPENQENKITTNNVDKITTTDINKIKA
tara:strand:+ start:12102 stop:14420 length:2319 start_codon:yes stop_codon:yes gene_type:complete